MRARVGGEGHDVEVDADRAHDDHGSTGLVHTTRYCGTGRVAVVGRDRRRRAHEVTRTDQRRVTSSR